ncbi:uncharacterized protein [Euphorbia lathyris]|uniref:uncharacterized protein n=1 Tax=Euphorbia lathyris TaxID=212925 RepID=UPI003313C059
MITPDSTALSYWLNWRVLLCAIWVFTPMLASVFILRKYEGLYDLRSCRGQIDHLFYQDRAWRPCLLQIHPIWLLVYRAIAFSLLLISLVDKVYVSGFVMFYYYTQWTFTSVTIYFGFGLMLSICGCYRHHKMAKTVSKSNDMEQGYNVALMNEENTNLVDMRKFPNPQDKISASQVASISTCLFQVLFQANAGAAMLTDCVYWAIIFPFLTIKDYNLNFMTVNMHTVNIVLLLGDAALNCLPFPWFRISYFILWTGFFVTFQWIIHACVSIWWPYPFLELSSPYAPFWYLLVGLLHLPCYGFFKLIINMKHSLFSKWFPESYLCLRPQNL